ncbi:MAG: ATP-binding protein [Spirochaetes bacterium]|nr:ATP-binding protein [Spirochaetota bacterium]
MEVRIVETNASRLTIVKKLRLLLALIIAAFVALMTYSTLFTRNMREHHNYLADHVLERNVLLSNMQWDFRVLSGIMINSFNNAYWLAAAGEESINALHAEVDSRIGSLVEQGRQYINALTEDIHMEDLVGAGVRGQAVSVMETILANLNEVHQYYRIDPATVQDAVFAPMFANFATPVINHLEEIRELNLGSITAVSENMSERQSEFLWINLAAFVLAILIILAASWLITDNLKKRVLRFEAKAERIKSGDFDTDIHDGGKDELSRLYNAMDDVVKVFSGMIWQVTKVANDISAGKVEARLEESNFEGSFHKAAVSINRLAEDVMKAGEAKAGQEYLEHVQFMLDTVPLVVTTWDTNAHVVNCNEEAARRYKFASKEEYIENWYKSTPPVQPCGTLSALKAKRYHEEVFEKGYAQIDWMHHDVEGNLIPSEIHCFRKDFMGQKALVSYAIDKRDHYKAIEEARKSAVAEDSSKAKSRFLARMSHEIRTPISAVLGISEIQLQNPSLPMAIEESFAKIYSSSQILLGIVNDILDLSKIESDKMEIMNEHYETASLINDIVQLNVFRIGSKQIKFELDIDPGIPSLMVGDELRIKQVMNNLLSNAFKYTESGRVNLEIKFLEREGESFLFFKVADTGCGMSEDDLKQLFTEFARFNENKHRNIEGIGLGMAIVESLVKLMDAKMNIESEVGIGTTIQFELPQKRASDDVLGQEMVDNLKNFKMSQRFAFKGMMFKPEPMPYGRVLVVDDVETNLYVAQGIMSFYNLNVETCGSGQAALDLVKKGNIYDVIFMDQMMPGMDGVETTKQIRKLGYKNPVVALTANALIGQSEMFIENGFDGFISKPIDTSHLNSILNKFIRDKQPHEVVEAARKNAEQKEQVQDSMRDFERSILREFGKSQKNAALDIRRAFEVGDIVSCRRFAHTLKGLARTIKEEALAFTASKLEDIFEKNENLEAVGLLLDKLDTQLAAVLAGIPPESNPLEFAGNGEEFDLEKVLASLEPLLQEDSADSLEAAKQLKSVPQAAILIRQIEEYDFEGALKNLPFLRKVAS